MDVRQGVDTGMELERIATGFGFTEGPAWSDRGGYLVFSDIPGDAMWRWDGVRGVVEYRRPSNMANGSTFDRLGRLISCEHATSRVVRREEDRLVVLADRFEGRELNSPNDVVVASDGSIYFTDPTYGRQEYVGIAREVAQPHRGVYRLRVSGELELVAADFGQPNGLCFSRDARVLYVNDSERFHIRAFDVRSDGSLGEGKLWADVALYREEGEGPPDGMKIDVEGRVYCAGPGGIHIFGCGGEHLGLVRVPEVVGNLCWGGSDRKRLFICASSSLYSMVTRVPGWLVV